MSKCKKKGCSKGVILMSDYCWAHIRDQKQYVRTILALYGHRGTRLRGVNLSEVDFQREELLDVDLSGACLVGTNLKEADLWRAILDRADLHGANLEGAYLWGASLVSTNLENARLCRAVLRRADLRYANLKNADLSSPDPKEGAFISIISQYKSPFWPLKPAFSETDLRGANFDKADLRGANLTNADLRRTRLHGADLSGAVLTGTTVWRLSCSGCKSKGVEIEYLNCDVNADSSGIVRFSQEEAEEIFR